MQDVHEWLSKKPYNYDEGVRIYLQYNRAPLFVSLFREAETPFKREKLVELMTELAATGKAEKTAPERPTEPMNKPAAPKKTYNGWPNETADPVIQALRAQEKPLYAEQKLLQGSIWEVAIQGEKGNTVKAMEAGQMAHRIVDLAEELQNIYRQRDYYLANNRLPENIREKEAIVDPVRWATRRQNIMRYIREHRSNIEKDPHNKKRPNWENKIRQYTAELAHLNKLLKLDD